MSAQNTNPMGRRSLLTAVAGAAGVAAVGAVASPAAAEAKRGGPLAGKTALVTGGARGAGKAIATKLAAQGADIALFDAPAKIASLAYPTSTPAELNATAREIARRHGVRCLPVPVDIRDAGQVEAGVAQVVKELRQLDIVIANAGVNTYGNLDALSPAAIKDVIDVNVTGTAYTLRAVAPKLKEKGQGTVIVIGSAEARAGTPGAAHYVASKWAVIGLLKSFALEMAGQNIRVAGVNPTVFRSAMVLNQASYEWAGVADEAELDALFHQIHSLDVGILNPEDVADAVWSLVSSNSRYISGTVIDVTAGLSSSWTA